MIRHTNYFSDYRSRICCTKYLRADNQDLSTTADEITYIIQSNPAVHLYFSWQAPVLNYLFQPFYFLESRGNKRLSTETRVDRKSTRLNSSHSSISYAVFC